jgi:hypothetical protein
MRITVNIADTSIPNGVAAIINNLPDNKDLSADDVEVVLFFRDAYIYRTGLVLLATWRKTLPAHVKVSIDDTRCKEEARRVITNCGFRDLIESNMEAPSNINYYPGKVPLQPVVQGYSTEQAISHICKIFESSAGVLDIKAFRTLLSELCENIYAHSKFETPGYIAAYLHNDKCEIAIADSGIGILNSYLEGSNDEAKTRISHGASAIELAVDGLVSSKPARLPGSLNTHYGYGLRIVRGLIEKNAGRLTIASGSEIVSMERYQKNRLDLARAWNGTFVGLFIDLQNPLSLEAVYDEIEKETFVPKTNNRSTAITDDQPALENEFVVANYGNQLLTRELGIAIRADLATLLSSGARVKVVLDGIDDITPSVADECFGKLAESMGSEKFKQKVILAGGHSLVQRLLDLVIKNRLANK